MRSLLLTLLAAAVVAPGCLVPGTGDVEHAELKGTADGYTAMADGLRIFVQTERGHYRSAVFDVEAWDVYAMQKERLNDPFPLHAMGTRAAVTAEVWVEDLVTPEDLSRYNFARNRATAEEKAIAKQLWLELVADLGEGKRVDLRAGTQAPDAPDVEEPALPTAPVGAP